MRKHELRIHEGRRPFVCDGLEDPSSSCACGQRFARRYELNRHLRRRRKPTRIEATTTSQTSMSADSSNMLMDTMDNIEYTGKSDHSSAAVQPGTGIDMTYLTHGITHMQIVGGAAEHPDGEIQLQRGFRHHTGLPLTAQTNQDGDGANKMLVSDQSTNAPRKDGRPRFALFNYSLDSDGQNKFPCMAEGCEACLWSLADLRHHLFESHGFLLSEGLLQLVKRPDDNTLSGQVLSRDKVDDQTIAERALHILGSYMLKSGLTTLEFNVTEEEFYAKVANLVRRCPQKDRGAVLRVVMQAISESVNSTILGFDLQELGIGVQDFKDPGLKDMSDMEIDRRGKVKIVVMGANNENESLLARPSKERCQLFPWFTDTIDAAISARDFCKPTESGRTNSSRETVVWS